MKREREKREGGLLRTVQQTGNGFNFKKKEGEISCTVV